MSDTIIPNFRCFVGIVLRSRRMADDHDLALLINTRPRSELSISCRRADHHRENKYRAHQKSIFQPLHQPSQDRLISKQAASQKHLVARRFTSFPHNLFNISDFTHIEWYAGILNDMFSRSAPASIHRDIRFDSRPCARKKGPQKGPENSHSAVCERERLGRTSEL